jgi:hypothetical protein
MEQTTTDKEMEIALRKMFQEMFPKIRISRSGVALLAAQIDALEKKCTAMRGLIVSDELPTT